ncbi:hypothetical protein GIB67_033906 [Kingdonia uniflora]|uniref:non-specific serine/threonine protein kinase n=1 Tax=Kingdonia uniflora TaxID=39325 RepID=A0A7J7NCF3_9MAGN|nr:hypothetical protein GIB67_033906 [Kingdonia uniflora]
MNWQSDYSEFVEVDPTRRYGRYNEILGKGASKTVYRAFDEFEGIEVAWNQVKLFDFLQSPEDLERLYCEIHLLKTLKHKNIMTFYSSWVDTANRNINFITEMFTSGTLRQYRQKHKRVNIRAVKHWCRQILRGLLYLHSHDPPVIHRDLKCDNIFVNGNQGEVKIGDLGLAAILRKSHAAHCVGTPEFMAPEVYKEEYNELVDIYSFGMCILEMVTFEYPYSECTHPAQIYKKVVSGKRPEALYKVKDPQVRQFIEKCLVTVSRRLSARELLMDPFLQFDDCGPVLRQLDCSVEIDAISPLLRQPLFQMGHNDDSLINGYSDDLDLGLRVNLSHENENGWEHHPVEIETSGIELFTFHENEHPPNIDITIRGRRKEDGSIFLRIRIADKEGRVRNIYFPFDIATDTALSVATEMVGELDITDQEVTKIADMIDGEIASLVPDWNPGPGLVETPRFSSANYCQNCASNRSSIGSFMDFLSSNNHDIKNVQFLQCSRNGCAAMHGRFEEITYQVEGSSEHCVTVGAPRVSSESDVWAHQENPDLSSERSCDSNSDEGHEPKGNNVIVEDFHIDPCTRSSDNYENEVRQQLRWIKARYQMELRELRSRQLGDIAKAPIFSPASENMESNIESRKVSLQGECNMEFLKSIASRMSSSTYFSDALSNFPNSETQRAQNGELTTCSSSPDHIFTAKSYYGRALLPQSLLRSTSLPVDAVDI